ncbi:hypothetical protein FQR65_LT05817 [Abscondita terminalis]|nr:hypothetical protein FQR65_LT05817 [Abscondita terminalis]
MAPILYYNEVSPPVRSVLLTAKALGLELEMVPINLFTGEHLKPEFVKKNPQHTVPTLEDNGHFIWDSHAINMYLCDKYGKDDSLYPKDLIKRGIVNQRLFFNASVMQPRTAAVVRRMIKRGISHIPTDVADNLRESYDFLEEFLENQKWVAGDRLTIADLCLIPAITSADILVPIDPIKYPNVVTWIGKCQGLPYYKEGNQIGLDNFKNLISTLR